MPAASRFVDALKRSVRARGLTYAELARRLQLSEASVKRMFSRGTFTLARIEEVLAAVDLDLYEVARMTRGAGNGPAQLSHEQELGLAKDERLLALFWLLLPPDKLDAFLCDAHVRCEEWRIALAGVEVRSTAQENDSFLRWARRDYAAVTLHLAPPAVLGAAVRTTQLRRSLIDAALAQGGSFAVSCTPEATRAQVEACYPQLREFLAEKRRIDPGERIVNGWYRHYRRLFGSPCAVRWTR